VFKQAWPHPLCSNCAPSLATQDRSFFCHCPRSAMCGQMPMAYCDQRFEYHQPCGLVSTSHLTIAAYSGTSLLIVSPICCNIFSLLVFSWGLSRLNTCTQHTSKQWLAYTDNDLQRISKRWASKNITTAKSVYGQTAWHNLTYLFLLVS